MVQATLPNINIGVQILTQHNIQENVCSLPVAPISRSEAAQLTTGWLPDFSKGSQEPAAVGPGPCVHTQHITQQHAAAQHPRLPSCPQVGRQESAKIALAVRSLQLGAHACRAASLGTLVGSRLRGVLSLG